MGRDDVLLILRDFKADYAEKYGILALGLFGSMVRDEAREDSDVDVFIMIKTPDPFVLVHIKNEIESRVHRRVDIVRIREKMNPYLFARIEKEGVYV